MKKYKHIFVILTYKSTSDLAECVQSIKKNVIDSKIVIVNSFFDDKSRNWFERFSLRENCDFINVENKGYGAGNNKGIEFAIEKYDFQDIIICNPDIIVDKFDEEVFIKYPNSVIAPIIKTRKGKMQNPYWICKNSIAEKFIYLGMKNKHKSILYCGYAINKILRQLGLFIFFRKRICERRIYAAHGSFLVIPKDILLKKERLYDEDMFLYAEEAYLAHYFENSAVDTFLTKKIEIIHKEDGSVGVSKIDEDSVVRQSIIYYYEKYVLRQNLRF